ncbi:hypothetical protein LPB86_17000 [Pedobacter sp. MC2016-14]|uniref:hypothetical protein n=1 Tax=Pedobacter sp. MC2016-14 TaxID=2897327 RepID=UPI001E43B0CE|nr:hypothetical protein [Pedobacter sp. MC2016-14]MCD0489943.1 hypothetical protein [Pedobacter sp. MC2016-14]
MSENLNDFLANLGDITIPTIPSDQPDELSASQLADFNRVQERIKTKTQRAILKNLKQDIAMRKEYADRIFQLLAFWLLFTACLVFLVALGKLELTENVLIALLTTSSANVIAIFIYVVKYLFARPSKPETYI